MEVVMLPKVMKYAYSRATSTLLDEVRLHQGHPLCNKSWIQCVYKISLEL